MKIAAVISEYNPFHDGHKYQIDEIKRIHGDNTAVIAIMSGNFTQRGELAIFDKHVRAKSAVYGGVNLVLELPFPYSMSSAEFFAKAGVYIADRLGVVNYLYFGSECGDIDKLTAIAQNISTATFTAELKKALQSRENQEIGYPAIMEAVYRKLFEDNQATSFFSPNNILAIEYIKALTAENSQIAPMTIKRIGAGYKESSITESRAQSATAIRELLRAGDKSAYNYMPNTVKNALSSYDDLNNIISNPSALDNAVIAKFRMNPPDAMCNIHDATGGLYNRLYAVSMKTNSISSLIAETETKKFTKARISRAVWNAFFSVTSSDLKANPVYTQVLAMDEVGQSVLKRIKKMSGFPVITKPASYRKYGDEVILRREFADRADSVYDLTLETRTDGLSPFTFTPFVKK